MGVLASLPGGGAEPVLPEPPSHRLSAADQATLASGLNRLLPGEGGWISFEEYDHLFATNDLKSGPHLWDLDGLDALERFAAAHDATHRAEDAEKRVYFVRNLSEAERQRRREERAKDPKAIGWEVYLAIAIIAGMFTYWMMGLGAD
jgi:hypothetical protein